MRHIPFIFVFAALVALTFVSCDDSGTSLSTTTTISLTSASVVVPCEGGIVPVRFTIGNSKTDGYTVASTEEDWISDFDFSVADTVSFYVEANVEREPRYGDVKLIYMVEADTLATNTILISQEYNSYYVFEPQYAAGQYYGMTNSYNNENIRQYSIYLSDNPIEEYGVFDNGATYYFIDLWSGADVSGVDYVSLPVGHYSFGQVGANWTVSENSLYFVIYEDGEDEWGDIYSEQGVFVDGSLDVTRVGDVTSIVGSLEDYYGGIHDISYSGEFSLTNFGLYTTLDGDEALGDISDVDCEARYYGDYYQTGTANWVLCIGSETGTGFIIDISADASYDMDGGIPVGTFSVSSTGGVAGTFIGGTVFNGYLSGSWLVSFDEDGALVAPYAPICDGTVEISASGDSYTVSIDGTDDRENSITGSWTGVPTVSDYRTSTVSLTRSGIRLLK